jgi:adenylate cyclase, class 2
LVELKNKIIKMEEIEVKFLNIDPVKTEKKLVALGAKRIFEKLYRRRVFDYPDYRLDKSGAWLRLRDEGEKITLTFKKRIEIDSGENGNDVTAEETGIVVNDFDMTTEMLLKLGFIEKHYVENKRIRYMLGDIEFDIDTYPQLEPYIEIEAPSWEKIDKGTKLLGFDKKNRKIYSATQIYKQKGIIVDDYKEITFDRMIKK